MQTSWPRYLVGAGTALVLAFTMLAPEASGDLTGAALLSFWTLHVFGALAALQIVQLQLVRLPVMARWSPWVQVLASGFVGAWLFTPLAAGLDWLYGLDAVPHERPEPVLHLLLSEFTGLVGTVTLFWVALNSTRLLKIRAPQHRATDRSVAPADFWDLVPDEIGRDLVALSAELHYLRVVTTRGDALVLFPFGKAVAQLDHGGQGLQIHRSHWVALAQVAGFHRRGQGGVCKTATGLELPVSRRRRPALETWLDART